jgi:hypothetical protein
VDAVPGAANGNLLRMITPTLEQLPTIAETSNSLGIEMNYPFAMFGMVLMKSSPYSSDFLEN